MYIRLGKNVSLLSPSSPSPFSTRPVVSRLSLGRPAAPCLAKFGRDSSNFQPAFRNDICSVGGRNAERGPGATGRLESLQRTSENQARVYQSRVPISTWRASLISLPLTSEVRCTRCFPVFGLSSEGSPEVPYVGSPSPV